MPWTFETNSSGGYKAWIEAAIVLSKNSSAEVDCPNCAACILKISDEKVGESHIDRHLKCMKCGAHEIIFIRVDALN